MKGRLIVAGFLVALGTPFAAFGDVIREQPMFSGVEHIGGDVPLVFSGASQRTPTLLSVFSATGTVRTAKIRYDMKTWSSPNGLQLYLYECPLKPGDTLPQCRKIVARDAALAWDGTLIHPPVAHTGELTVDFTSAQAIGFGDHEFTDGVPLNPDRGYRLEGVFDPNSHTIDVYGMPGETGGFFPYFKLEGDVPTSTPATSTPPTCTENCNSNVMFLPGIEASSLYAPGLVVGDKVWLPNSLGSNDASVLDMSNSERSNSVFAREKGIVDRAYAVYSVYESLIADLNTLKLQQYIADWKPIAYDWRLDYSDLLNSGAQTEDGRIYYNGPNSGTTTETYIVQELKSLAASSRTGKVTIVAHSNGGLLAKEILTRPELTQYVDKVIMVGAPQTGTPQAVGGLLHGFNLALPKEYLPLFLTSADARYLGQSMPMAYNLLPSDAYFQNVSLPVVSFDASTLPEWAQKYGSTINTENALRQFMTDTTRENPQHANIRVPEITRANLHADAASTHQLLDGFEAPSDVQLITIAGWGNRTVSGITYKKLPVFSCVLVAIDGSCSAGKSESQTTYEPQFVLDGDGTVIDQSAMWGNGESRDQYWLNLYDLNSASSIHFEHANMLETTQVRELITSLLVEETTPALPNYVSQSKPVIGNPIERLLFILHSPLALGFTDGTGKFTGANGSEIAFEVTGVEYERFGEVQWLSVPKAMAGTVVLKGLASGSFALDVMEVDGDSVTARTTFAAVESATSTSVKFEIDPSISPATNGVLLVDLNGDGNFEKSLKAQVGEVVLPDLIAPEASISVSTSTKDIVITGIDTSSTTVLKSSTSTSISDTGGNRTTLYFKKRFAGNVITYARVTGISYGTSTTALPTSFVYIWDDAKTPVSQTIVVDKVFGIQALYDKRRDRTTIIVLKKGVPIQSQTLPGLRLIKLTTNRGVMSYSW